jgi:H+/gluconate symporter-like permease
MKQDKLILSTAKISYVVQIIAGIIGIYGIFIQLPAEHLLLREILVMETIVQFIELIYYTWLINQFKNIHYNVTTTRYFDWAISTPIMILSTILFMIYKNKKETFDQKDISREKNDTQNKAAKPEPETEKSIQLSFVPIVQENSDPILKTILSNQLMLLFGYLGENGVISRLQGFIWGSFFFMITFAIIYVKFVGTASTNHWLFWFMLIAWSLYGVAYCLQYKTKNIMYNFLDIFSKNFYGFFLVQQILQVQQ